MITYITDTLVKLTAADSPTGFTDRAARLVFDELSSMGYKPVFTNKGGVLCKVSDGDTEDGLILTAHIDTLGGMVFSTFSSIPEDGSTPVVEINGLKIQVEKICDHRVESALVSKLEPKPDNDEAQEEE